MKAFTSFTRTELVERLAAINATIGTFGRGRPRRDDPRPDLAVDERRRLLVRRRYYARMLAELDAGTRVSLNAT